MLEIIYRIYLKTSEYEKKEITMECLTCENRETFKEIIRDLYGKDILFRYSNKLDVGKYYCIIIGEHAYSETIGRHFGKIEFECAECGSKITFFLKEQRYLNCYKIDDYKIRTELGNEIEKYSLYKFCSYNCQRNFIEKHKKQYLSDDLTENVFITRDSFTNSLAGYIYKISKRNTGEFYVGQTMYMPIFRWGQHLLTERFKADNITDYIFEVLEIVKKGENILEREKFWINNELQKNPNLSLNISCTAELRKIEKEKGEGVHNE